MGSLSSIRDSPHLGGPVISPKRLCHMVLRSQPENYKTMVDWYVNFLGGRVVWGNDSISFITYDDEHHRIAITGRPGTNPRGGSSANTVGLAHIAFAYDNLTELCVTYLQRKKLGIRPSWCVNHGMTTSIYYADPDGNEVETQVDHFENSEDATAYMNTKAFAENPLGVDFDPEELIDRVERGEPEAEIFKRPDIGPRTKR